MNKGDFIEKEIITKSSEETKKLGFDFAKTLQEGDIVCLYGDLGSGKTTFVQGLAEGLGIKNKIISPTFIIVRKYDYFYHVDLYRIESPENLGLIEILNDKSSIVAIEWAEKLGSLTPDKRIDIKFSHADGNTRKILFNFINE